MRKNVKFTSNVVSGLNTEMPTARFENVEVGDELEGNSTITYTDLTVYGGIKNDNYKTDGNASLTQFRETLISLRTQLKSTKSISGVTVAVDDKVGFSVYLRIENEDDSNKPYYIEVSIYRKVTTAGSSFELGDDEYGCIRVLTKLQQGGSSDTNKYYYGMKELIVDSDIDDRIWRFVGENEWRSTTYLILDMNKNLAINKGAYLTLNTVFNDTIGWYEPIRKSINGWANNSIGKIDFC